MELYRLFLYFLTGLRDLSDKVSFNFPLHEFIFRIIFASLQTTSPRHLLHGLSLYYNLHDHRVDSLILQYLIYFLTSHDTYDQAIIEPSHARFTHLDCPKHSFTP